MTRETPAIVSVNGRLLPADEARISPLGDGFLFGAGVFETIRVVGGKPAFFAEHMARLRHGAAELGLSQACDERETRERCAAVIGANRLDEGSLKLVAFEDSGKTGLLMTVRHGGYAPEAYARGFRLRTVPDGRRTGSLSSLKSLNYLKNISAKREAQADGFDEPLFVGDGGLVLEGATSNIFCVRGSVVETPALGLGILPGIVRGVLLGGCAGLRVREGAVTLEGLLASEEVFVTNSLLGVMPVCAVDSRPFEIGRVPLTTAIAAQFRVLESQSLGGR